jgi:ATP-binding cassette subfamily C protein EexD
MPKPAIKKDSKSRFPELNEALQSVRQYFIYAGVFSVAVNLLMLVPIIYMMQVYDRVISSGSLSTLAMLTIILVCLMGSMGVFEWVRSMFLIGASDKLDRDLRERVFQSTFKNALSTNGASSSAQPISDLTGLRQYISSNAVFGFFDAPWFPIYVFIMFMFHPWFGVIAIFAGIVMFSLALANEIVTNKKMQDANTQNNWVNNEIVRSLRNAEVIAAMGMMSNVRRKQQEKTDKAIALQTNASRWAGGFLSFSKSFRVIIQSLALGLGALLALKQEISPGMMIAGSLLLGRALAPIDLLVNSWKGFSVARAQYKRLGELLETIPPEEEKMSLPAPKGHLLVENVVVSAPGSQIPVLKGISLELKPGEAIGILGPSASGKSTLARTILGIWPTRAGAVRLDGADVSAWDREELGPSVGYLPQDIELFDGSISENICRFGKTDSEKIIAAAQLAGVHEMILKLPEGYDTVIGGTGGMLSGGQRQLIGLARAVYDSPRLLVLDEPNSNLDEQGEQTLAQALKRIKSKGCSIVVITHRNSILQVVDNLLILKEGTAIAYGPKEKVLATMMAQIKNSKQSASGAAAQA